MGDKLTKPMDGPIRLGCLYCDRDDCDGIWEMPTDWQSIEEAQPSADSGSWETHLGVCPGCIENHY